MRERLRRRAVDSPHGDLAGYAVAEGTPSHNATPPLFQELERRLLLSGTITGSVFDDVNTNGIFDAGELGTAGVTVRLDLDGNGSFIDAGDLSAVTDANGLYTLNNVPVGSFVLAQDVPGGTEQTSPVIPDGTGDGAMSVVDFLQNNGTDHFGNLITDMDQPNKTVLSPDGRYLIAWTTRSDSMLVFRREAATGELELIETLIGADGNGNSISTTATFKSHTYSPDGRFIYTTPSSSIQILKQDGTTGQLTLVDTIANNGTDSAGNSLTGMSFPGDVEISPDGRFAYVPSSSQSAVLVFSRNNATGELVFLERYLDGGLDTAGNTINTMAHVRYVTLSPDGKHFYATSQTDRSIVIFERNEATGALTLVDELVEGGTDSFGTPMLGVYDKPEFVTLSNNGTSFYYYDDGIKGNHVFQREAATGKLAYVQTFDDSRVVGNKMDMVFNADDTIGYFVISGRNEVISVTRNPTDGSLAVRQILTLSGSGDPHTDISLSPDGRFIYTDGGLLDAIWRIAVNEGPLQPTNQDVVVGDGQTLVDINFGNAALPFEVTQTSPSSGAVFSQEVPSQLTIHFSNAVDIASLQPSDLQVNGASAIGVTLVDTNTVTFDLDYVGLGLIEYTLAAGSVLDTSGQAIDLFTDSFSVTAPQLVATGVVPADGAVVLVPAPTTIRVQFNHAIDATSVVPSDLLIDGVPATGQASASQFEATFTVSGLSLGEHTIELAEGAVVSTAGVHMEAFSSTFTVAPVPFLVTSTTPVDGAAFENAGPSQITVRFNDDIDVDSIAKEDLTVNGVAATGVTVTDGTTAVFDLPATGEGTHTYAIAQDAIIDADGTGVGAFSGEFTVTIPPFVVLSSVPVNGAAFENTGPAQLTIQFNDVIDVNSLAKEDLAVDGISATGFTVSNSTTVVFDLPATGVGNHTFAIAQGAIVDAQGTAVDAFSGQFTVVSSTGTITGNVFDDVNANGNFDSGELGIADVTVRLDMDGNGIFIDAGDLSVITDASGQYSFADVPVGSYVLSQDVPAGMDQTTPVVLDGTGDGSLSVIDFIQNNVTDHFGNPITDMDQPNHTILSPDGQYLVAWATKGDSMSVFRREASTGDLELLETLIGADGSGNIFNTANTPLSYTYSPDSRFLYTTLTASILIFEHDDVSGLVTLVDTIANNGTDSAGNPITGMTFPADVEISPDGNFAYVPTSNEHAILVFNRNNSTGELVFLEKYVDGGLDAAGSTINVLAHVRYVVLSPDGKHFYATSATDRSIVVFERNETTGALTLVDELVEGGTDSFGTPLPGNYDRPEFVTLSNDGTSFYYYDDGIRGVHVFEREVETGKLAYVHTFDDSLVVGNQMDLVFNADDTIGYFVISGRNEVLSVTRNTTDGSLALREILPLSEGADPHRNISLSPDGRFIYTEGGLIEAIWRVAVDVGSLQPANQAVLVGGGETVSGVNFGNEDQSFEVLRTFPPSGVSFSHEVPSQLTIQFSNDVDVASLQPSDLQVNGVSAIGVTLIDADKVLFDLEYIGLGLIEYTLVAGSILDKSGQAIDSFTDHFNVTAPPFLVTGVIPAEGEIVLEPGPTTIRIQFNNPVEARSVRPFDLLIDGEPATGQAGAGLFEVTFVVPELSLGEHTIELAEGAVISTTGVHMEAFSSTFTVTPVPFLVTSTTPVDGAAFENAGPSQITVRFNDDIDVDSIAKEDLTVNGVAATDVTVTNGTTAVFDLPTTGEGTHTYAIAQGAIIDAEGTGVDAFSGQFTVTIPPFVVLSSVPVNGAAFENAGPAQLTIQFNDVIDVNSLSKEDLTVDGVAATGLTAINSTTVVFDLPVTGEGTHTFAIAQGVIVDAQGTAVDAFSGQFSVTIPPFVVLSTTPVNGAAFENIGPAQLTVQFNDVIDTNSLAKEDLTVGGVSATGFTVTNSTTVIFDLPVTGEGNHTFAIAQGAIVDAQGTDVDAFSGQFSVTVPPFVVLSTNPASGTEFFGGGPSQISVVFNADIDPESLAAEDLTIDGVAATGVSVLGDTATFTLPVAGAGTHTFAIATGAIQNTADTGNQAFSGTFSVDPAPRVISTSVSDGQILRSADLNFLASFDINLVGVSVDDVALVGATSGVQEFISFNYNSSTRTLSASVQGLPDDLYTLTLISDGLRSGNGVALDGELPASGTVPSGDGIGGGDFVINFEVEVASTVIVDLQIVEPLGGQIYSISLNGALTDGDDDVYHIDLDAGHALSIGFDPLGNTAARVELRDPGNNVLVTRTVGAGSSAFAQLVPLPVAGTYVVIVDQLAGGPDTYDLELRLNAQIEEEQLGGTANDQLSPLAIDDSFLPLAGGAEIAGFAGFGDAVNHVQSLTIEDMLFSPNVLNFEFVLDETPVGDAQLVIVADGNLGGTSQSVLIDIEGRVIERVFVFDGNVSHPITATMDITAHDLAALAADGVIQVTATPSSNVGNTGSSFLTLSLEYPIADAGGSEDVLSFDLTQGEVLSFVAAAERTGTALELVSPTGVVIASDQQGFSFEPAGIHGFEVRGTGTHTLRVVTTGQYHVVVTREAEFDGNFNEGAAQVQALEHTGAVAGYLGDDLTAGRLFVITTSTNAIEEIDPLTGIAINRFNSQVLAVGFSAYGLATTPNTLLVAGDDSSPIMELDPNTGASIRVIDNPGFDFEAMAFQDGEIYLINQFQDMVVLDYKTGEVVRELESTGTAIFDALGAAHGKIYGLNNTTLLEINPVTGVNTVIGTIPSSAAGSDGIGVVGDELFLADNSVIAVVDLNTLELKRNMQRTSFTRGIAGDPPLLRSDDYSFAAQQGDTITIETSTPSDGQFQFNNQLDPVIDVFDPTGQLIEVGDNELPDGRNPRLVFTAAETGVYVVRVRAADDAPGEYVLTVAGNTAAPPTFAVANSYPVDGSQVKVSLTDITIEFDRDVFLPSLDVSDLILDGNASATSVRLANSNTAVFTVPTLVEGMHTISIAGGTVESLGGATVDVFSAQFDLDFTPPHVVASSILEGETLISGTQLLISMQFNEALDPVTVSNLATHLIDLTSGTGISESSVVYDEATFTLTSNFGVRDAGDYQYQLLSSSNGIADIFGFRLDGESHPTTTVPTGDGVEGGDFLLNFSIDQAEPVAITDIRPIGLAGVSAYEADVTAMIRGVNDVDTFAIDLEAGQLLSLSASAVGASLEFELFDPNGQSLGSVSGTDLAELSSIDITEAGVYAINVTAGTPADVQLHLLLNILVEAESVGGATNNTIANAQSLNDALVTFGGIARTTVQGHRDDATDALQTGESPGDIYSLDLQAGEAVTFVIEGDRRNFSFDLLDAAGNVLAIRSPENDGVARFNHYVATANEQVFVRVEGDVTYALTAIMGAGQESDPSVPTSGKVLGRTNTLASDLVVGSGLGHQIHDGEGNLWSISSRFDTSVSSFLDDNLDNFFYSGFTLVEAEGREFATQPTFVSSNVTQVRKAYFSPDRAVVRYLDVFENTGSFSRNISFQVDTILDSSIISLTSSGDSNPTTLDNWAILESSNTPLPRVGVVFDGASNNSPLIDVEVLNRGIRPRYNLFIPAQTTVAIMRFTFLHDDETTDPALIADELLEVPEDLLVGLTQSEREQIVNFNNLPSPIDRYTVEVNAGDSLLIQTQTLGLNAGLFENTLDPFITLFDPSGTVVATDNNSAVDGKNVLLTHTALVSGTYSFDVDALAGDGDYILSVEGNTGSSESLEVESMSPAIGSHIGFAVSKIDIFFDDAVLLTTVDASDLQFNGAAATGVQVLDGQTLRFTLAALSPEGVNQVSIDGGAMLGIDGTPLAAFSEQFTVDLTPPTIIASSLLIDDVVTPGTLIVELQFSEQLDPTTIDRNRVQLVGTATRSADVVHLSGSGDRIEAVFSNVIEGDYTFNLTPGSNDFEDLVGLRTDGEADPVNTVPTGNGVAGGTFSVPFRVEFESDHPLSMEALRPLGNLATRGGVVGSLDDTDLDRLTLELNSGQTLSVLMRNANGLQGAFRVIGPGGEVAMESAAASDDDVFTQALPITQIGTYVIELSSVSGSGDYELEVLVNAVFEQETLDGTDNGGVGSAIDLNALATALPGSVGHVANVVGTKDLDAGIASQTQSGTFFEPNVLTFEFDNLPQPGADGIITISVDGDVDGSSDEDVVVDIEGLISQTLFTPSGSQVRTEDITVTLAQWNTLLADGTLTVTLTPGAQVDNFGGNFATVSVDYPLAGFEGGDFYSLALTAGESASIAVRATELLDGGSLDVKLRDTDGSTVLALGNADLRFVERGIVDFIAPTTGVYILQVTGDVDYVLTATRGVIFDAEAVTNEPNITLGNNTVVGHVNTHGTGRLFVAEANQDRIVEVDPLTGEVLNAFDAPVDQVSSSTGLAVTNTSILFGTGSGNIIEMDMDTGATIREIANPGIDIRGLAYQDGKLFARRLLSSSSIAVIDYATGDLIEFLGVGPVTSSSDSLLGAGVNDLYSAISSSIRIVDPNTGLSFSAPVFAGGSGLGVNGHELYAGTSSRISVLDTDTFNLNRELFVPFSVQALGADGSFDADLFELNLNVGDALTISTSTPFDALPGTAPLNPIVELIDTDGNVLVSDDNGAVDGRNATLDFTATEAGVYFVRVSAADGTEGSYLLSTSGATGVDPFVARIVDPADGQSLKDVSEITIEFSEAFNLNSVDLTDLIINGGFADTLTILDDRTLLFGFDTALVGGDYVLTLAAGSLADLQGTGTEELTSTFSVDNAGPRVVDISIQQDDVIATGDLTLAIVFDEALGLIGSGDLTVMGSSVGNRFVSNIEFDDQTFTLTAMLSDLPEDSYTLRLLSGDFRFEDLLGNDLDGEATAFPIAPNVSGDGVPGGDFIVDFVVDSPDTVGLAFAPVEPLGSFVYAASAEGQLTSGDTDRFELDFVAGQTASVRVGSGISAGTQLRVFDSLNTLLIDVPLSTATGQLLTINTTGTHTIEVSSTDGVQSLFDFEVLLNTSIEDELADNDTLANAQDINASAFQIGHDITRFAVSGTVSNSDIDFYSFSAQAGQVLSFGAFSTVSSIPDGVQLIDPNGTVIAETINVDSVHEIVAPTTGTYLLSIDLDFSSEYLLTVVADAVFSPKPNEFGSPVADITESGAAVGYLADVERHAYTFEVSAGDQLVIETHTPDAGVSQIPNGFNPRIELFDPKGDFVTDDDNELLDGINAQISHTALMDGVYSVLVDVADAEGEYVVTVVGQSGLPFEVATSTINDGETIAEPTNSVEVTFTRDIDPASVAPGDFLIDGVAATGVDSIDPGDPRTVVFTFDSLIEGSHTFELRDDSILDLNGNSIAAFAGTFDIHLTGPRVVAVSVSPNHLFDTSDFSVDFTFNEAINFDQLNTADVQLVGATASAITVNATSLTYDEATLTLTAFFTNTPQNDYTLNLRSGTDAFEDAQGADLDGEFNGELPPNSSGDGQQGGDFAIPISVVFGTFDVVSPVTIRTSSINPSVSITFNRPVDPDSLSASDLIIPGININGIQSIGNGYGIRFASLASSSSEPQAFDFELPAGAVVDYLGNPNEAVFGTLILDNSAPRVVDISVQHGELLTGPDQSIVITFSEPMRPTTVDTRTVRLVDLFRDREVGIDISYGEDFSTATINATDLQDGRYQLTLDGTDPVTHIEDLQGFTLDGEFNGPLPGNRSGDGVAGGDFVIEFDVDALTQPLVDIEALRADSSLGYTFVQQGQFSGVDTDEYSLDLEGGQILSVDLLPHSTQMAMLEIRDPNNTLIALAQASTFGDRLFLNGLTLADSGVYKITVSGDAFGEYKLQGYINAVVEVESVDGSSNDDLANAQVIDPHALAIASGARRFNVVGQGDAELFEQTRALTSDYDPRSTQMFTFDVSNASFFGLGKLRVEASGDYDADFETLAVDIEGMSFVIFEKTSLGPFIETIDIPADHLIAAASDGTIDVAVTAPTSVSNTSSDRIQLDLSFGREAITADYYRISLAAGEHLDVRALADEFGIEMEIVDATDTTLLVGVTQTDVRDQHGFDFVAPSTGDYFIKVVNATGSYMLEVASNASIHADELPRNLIGTHVAVGGMFGTFVEEDQFTVSVSVGDALVLETQTPGDQPGLVDNELNTQLTLLDPTGTVVEMDFDSAADGRNARIEHTATMDGIYTVRVGIDSQSTAPGLRGDYYSFDNFITSVPSLDGLTPLFSRVDSEINFPPTNFDFADTDLRDRFVVRWTGFIQIDTPGEVEFNLTSDDGSLLFIDDELIIDNDGLHPPITKTGSVFLEAGAHRIQVDMFENLGGAAAILAYTPVGGVFQIVPEDILSHVGTSTAVVPEPYVLLVDGNTGPMSSFGVAALNLPLNGSVNQNFDSVTVDFTAGVHQPSLDASDFTIDGITADSFEVIDGNIVQFNFASPFTEGVHQLNMASGVISNTVGTLNELFSTEVTVDTAAPRITDVSIAPGQTVASGQVAVNFTFDGSMDRQSIDASDISLAHTVGGTKTPTLDWNVDGTVLTVTYESLLDDNYTLTLRSGETAFQDEAGNHLDGETPGSPIPPGVTGDGVAGGDYALDFVVDTSTLAITSLARSELFAGLMFISLIEPFVGEGDVDTFTYDLEAGQTLTLSTGHVDSTVQVDIIGPDDTVLASGFGNRVQLPIVPVTEAGEYRVVFTGLSGSGFVYTQIQLNGALRQVADTPPTGSFTNTHSGAPQNIDDAFISVGTGLRAAVGSNRIAAGDFYSFNMNAGEVVTIVATGPDAFRLQDTTGTSVALSERVLGSLSEIRHFVAPFTGTYVLGAMNKGNSEKSFNAIVITRDLSFPYDISPDTMDQALEIIPAFDMMGFIQSNDSDFFKLDIRGGETLTLQTQTPGVAAGLFDNDLDPLIELLDIDGNVLKSNDNGALDGRNAVLTHELAFTGTYFIRVTSADESTGQFLLSAALSDVTAPTSLAEVVNGSELQRSMVRQFAVQFNEDVSDGLNVADLMVMNMANGELIDAANLAMSWDAATNTATWTFPALFGQSLPDGNYQALLSGDQIMDNAGLAFDGDGDGQPGGDLQVDLHRLYGDVDGDRDVDLSDLFRFRSAFGTSNGDPLYRNDLDIDTNDAIGLLELFRFRNNFGTELLPAAPLQVQDDGGEIGNLALLAAWQQDSAPKTEEPKEPAPWLEDTEPIMSWELD